ncbi:hypothetical protein [Rhodococcus wratislaviensis]|uniref:hypothetical protein n=1 Tax=Rhodococcus wratislaviensis TaxID=44752 RepID=UPI00366374BA
MTSGISELNAVSTPAGHQPASFGCDRKIAESSAWQIAITTLTDETRLPTLPGYDVRVTPLGQTSVEFSGPCVPVEIRAQRRRRIGRIRHECRTAPGWGTVAFPGEWGPTAHCQDKSKALVVVSRRNAVEASVEIVQAHELVGLDPTETRVILEPGTEELYVAEPGYPMREWPGVSGFVVVHFRSLPE